MNKQINYFILLISALMLNQIALADMIVSEKRLQRMERQISQISELMIDVQSVQSENRRLRGIIEEQQYALTRLKRRQQEFFADIDERIERLSKTQQSNQTQPSQQLPMVANEAEPHRIKNEQADYKRAYSMLSPKKKQYNEAIIAFKQFIVDYPQSESLPNAYYWLGEANYVLGQNNAALNAFRSVLKRFPSSLKSPAALLKIGYLQLAEGQRQQGEKTLSLIIRKYPSSSVAKMARKRLNQIR